MKRKNITRNQMDKKNSNKEKERQEKKCQTIPENWEASYNRRPTRCRPILDNVNFSRHWLRWNHGGQVPAHRRSSVALTGGKFLIIFPKPVPVVIGVVAPCCLNLTARRRFTPQRWASSQSSAVSKTDGTGKLKGKGWLKNAPVEEVIFQSGAMKGNAIL